MAQLSIVNFISYSLLPVSKALALLVCTCQLVRYRFESMAIVKVNLTN